MSSMELRARAMIFWPGITADIHKIRAECHECNKNAPSQAPLPSTQATPPSTPFEAVFADFLDFGGHHYLVVGDRLSGWVEIFASPVGSPRAGAMGLIASLRAFFATFGVPGELSSDGGPEFTASATRDFLYCRGISHRVSSAHHPQSNGRAEVAVKSAKRLLRSNVGPTGVLDNDRLLRADPDCNVSPAQIVFGKQLRDSFSFVNRLEKYSNPFVRPEWQEAWHSKEVALRARFVKSSESLNEHVRPLRPIHDGDRCFIQNQVGNSPKRWDRTGTVVETLGHDQYRIKVDGSGRLTTRNRMFLRAFVPAFTEIQERAHAGPSMPSLAPPALKPPDAALPRPGLPYAAPRDPCTDTPCVAPPSPSAPHERPTDDDLPAATLSLPILAPASPPHGQPPPLSDASPPAPSLRPRRAIRQPRVYEPETGHWISP
ncbi:PREDICTED: uncharacterized protein LOC106818759 [Priapulus caudatus]|uniref:Uncharacterized protein LOC106818759 n=1 Tax=Priapulus caudatus TaxID=37621 RepID=A0ABM1F396_PRICU|nr:PREDICTED: uncharacterized protein LOC106818759 [Priapulus caudatus]